MPVVELYTKTYCPYCWRAKHLLDERGVAYREISVDVGGDAREEMVRRSNGGATVPQIFIGGHHVGGCTELVALEREGGLDELLAA